MVIMGRIVLASAMKFHRLWIVALLLVSLSALRAATADSDTPATVVKALYRSSLDHFGFSPESVKAAKPFVTPDLYARMLKKVNEPTPKGDAPDIEGDLFLNAQDVPTKWEVGDSSITAAKAEVKVNLHWDSEKRQYTVLLKQVDGAWKVYDVDYGKDGKLSDLL
jgi:hypothetical protein